MTSRIRRVLLGLALCLPALLAPASGAAAATYVLDPGAQVFLDPEWTFSAGTSSLAVALDKGVAQPTVPALTPYATATLTSGTNASAAVNFAPTPTLATGETLNSVTGWVYLQTGSAQSVAIQLWIGTWFSPVLLGQTVVPSGTAAGWHSVTVNNALTQTQLGQLGLNVLASASGNGTNSTAYAAQLVIDTTDPPAAPAAPSGGGGASPPSVPSVDPVVDPLPVEDPPASPDPAPAPPATDPGPLQDPLPALVAPQRSFLAADGSVKVKVGCAVAVAGFCHGRVLLRLRGPLPKPKSRRHSTRAHAAHCTRVCRDLGSSDVTIAAGKSQPVKVHLAPKIRHIVFHGRKRIVVTAVVRLHTPDGRLVSSSSALTLLRG